MKILSLFFFISFSCSTDSLKFSEAASTVPRPFCGQISGALAFETCGPKLDIEIVTRASPDNSYDGASIYYEGKLNKKQWKK